MYERGGLRKRFREQKGGQLRLQYESSGYNEASRYLVSKYYLILRAIERTVMMLMRNGGWKKMATSVERDAFGVKRESSK